jgi:tape measure domain-containing protein
MAESLEEILVRIRADVSGLRRGLNDAAKATKTAAGRMSGHWEGLRNSIDQTVRRTARLSAVLAGVAAGAAIVSVVRLQDQYRVLEGRLRVVTDSADELRKVQERLARSSLENGTSLEGALTVYQRLALATKQTSISSNELLDITEGLQKAFLVSGASAQEARNALIQLSQGLSSGQLRGEEFRSVAEQGTRILQALERQLGKTRGELIEMAFAGEITTDVFLEAFTKELPRINEEFAKLPDTVGRAIERIRGSLLNLVGGSEEASVAQDKLINALNNLAKALNKPSTQQAFGNLIEFFADVIEYGGKGINVLLNWEEVIGEIATKAEDLVIDDIFGDAAGFEAVIDTRISALEKYSEALDQTQQDIRNMQEGKTGDLAGVPVPIGEEVTANVDILAEAVQKVVQESGSAAAGLRVMQEALDEADSILAKIGDNPALEESRRRALAVRDAIIEIIDQIRISQSLGPLVPGAAPRSRPYLRPNEGPMPAPEKPEMTEDMMAAWDKANEDRDNRIKKTRAALDDLATGYERSAQAARMSADAAEIWLAVQSATDVAIDGGLSGLDAQTEARIRAAIANRQLSEAEQELQDALDRGQQSADAIIKNYERQIGAIGLTTEELILYNAEQEIANLLADESKIVTEAQIKAIRDKANVLAQVTKAQEAADEADRKAQEAAEEAARQAQDFGNAIATAFEDAIINGESLGDVLKALEQDILRIMTRILITKPLETSISNLFRPEDQQAEGGIFGPLGGIFGGSIAQPPINPETGFPVNGGIIPDEAAKAAQTQLEAAGIQQTAGTIQEAAGTVQQTTASTTAATNQATATLMQTAATMIQTAATTMQAAAYTMQQAAAQMAASSGGGGSLFGDLLGGVNLGPGDLVGSAGGSLADIAAADIAANPMIFKSGGIAGVSSGQGMKVPSAVFAGAPHARRGMMIPDSDAVPIIAHRGERILNKQETAAYNRNEAESGPRVTQVFNIETTGDRMKDEKNAQNIAIRSREQLAKAGRNF